MLNTDQSNVERLLLLALSVTAERNRDTILRRFLEAAAEITDAAYGAVGVLDPHGNTTDFLWTGIPEHVAAKIGAPPMGHGVFSQIPDDRYLVVNDLASYEHRYPWPAHHPRMTNFLGAPIHIGSSVFGRLYLADKPGGFGRIDGRNCAMLAKALAVALSNAQARETLQADNAETSTPERYTAADKSSETVSSAQDSAPVSGKSALLHTGRAAPARPEVSQEAIASLAVQLDAAATQLTGVRNSLAAQARASQPLLNRLDVVIHSLDDSREKAHRLAERDTSQPSAGTE